MNTLCGTFLICFGMFGMALDIPSAVWVMVIGVWMLSL